MKLIIRNELGFVMFEFEIVELESGPRLKNPGQCSLEAGKYQSLPTRAVRVADLSELLAQFKMSMKEFETLVSWRSRKDRGVSAETIGILLDKLVKGLSSVFTVTSNINLSLEVLGDNED